MRWSECSESEVLRVRQSDHSESEAVSVLRVKCLESGNSQSVLSAVVRPF